MTLPSTGIAVAESIHATEFRMAPRTEPYNKVLVVLRGRTALQVAGTRGTVLHASCAAPLHAGTTHWLVDKEPATVLILALSQAYVNELPARREVWQVIHSVGAQQLDPATLVAVRNGIRAILHLQHQVPAPHGSRVELRVRTHADSILSALAANDHAMAHQTSRDRVARSLSTIVDAPFQEWSSEAAAERAALSVRRFTELQREITGTSFQQWLRSVRTHYAAALLHHGAYTVSTAAFAAGFSSLATFYRVFRNEMGCSPGEWAAAANLGEEISSAAPQDFHRE